HGTACVDLGGRGLHLDHALGHRRLPSHASDTSDTSGAARAARTSLATSADTSIATKAARAAGPSDAAGTTGRAGIVFAFQPTAAAQAEQEGDESHRSQLAGNLHGRRPNWSRKRMTS